MEPRTRILLNDCFMTLGQRSITREQKRRLQRQIARLMERERKPPRMMQAEPYSDSKLRAAGE